jgi:hypothetical protein
MICSSRQPRAAKAPRSKAALVARHLAASPLLAQMPAAQAK